MCEHQKIRYVHFMEHPDYSEGLACGCVCAGKMEEDYVAAKRREKKMKNVVQRRKRWLSRKWNISKGGNDYIKTDGYLIVVFSKADEWSGTITNLATLEETKARKTYSTQDAAKLAAFDGMIWLQSH